MSDNSIERGRQIAMAMMDRAEARWRHEHKQAHNRAHCELCAPEFQCPACETWALWTDGQMAEDGDGPDEFWCQTCGAESLLRNCARREQEATDAR
jgi:hypothetical protein